MEGLWEGIGGKGIVRGILVVVEIRGEVDDGTEEIISF